MRQNEPDRPAHAPRILFVLMSAVVPAATVDQLAQALAPHTVLVHHDFSQQPQFALSAPNVRFVPHPRRTGWGVFGFVDGIFHSLAHALAEIDFDYVQLLSPSCLPIKPLRLFEAHALGQHEAHFGAIDLRADQDALMSVGWRAFTPAHTLRHRVARRLTREYYGDEWQRRDEAGIWLRSGERQGMLPWLARGAMRALSRPGIGRHLFEGGFVPYYGSVWFGARTRVVRAIVDGFREPGVREYFSRLHLAEEFLLPTLLMQAAPSHGHLNHFIQRFDEAHPGLLVEEHLDMLRAQPAFFARKFPTEVTARVRACVLQELCRPDAPPPAERLATAGEERTVSRPAPVPRGSVRVHGSGAVGPA